MPYFLLKFPIFVRLAVVSWLFCASLAISTFYHEFCISIFPMIYIYFCKMAIFIVKRYALLFDYAHWIYLLNFVFRWNQGCFAEVGSYVVCWIHSDFIWFWKIFAHQKQFITCSIVKIGTVVEIIGLILLISINEMLISRTCHPIFRIVALMSRFDFEKLGIILSTKAMLQIAQALVILLPPFPVLLLHF